jgi:hypothetical protein
MGQEVCMWRSHLKKLLMTGTVGAMLTAGSVTSSDALTVPVRSAGSVAGPAPTEQVYYRYYWRRGYNPTGAIVAGAALGLIGAAVAGSSYYGYPYSYGYYPAYYGYYPRAYYRYPVGYYGYYRRAYYGWPYYRRAYYGGPYWGAIGGPTTAARTGEAIGEPTSLRAGAEATTAALTGVAGIDAPVSV